MPVGFLVPVPQSGEAERHVGCTAACGQPPLVEVNEVESTSALEQDMEYSEATAEALKQQCQLKVHLLALNIAYIYTTWSVSAEVSSCYVISSTSA